jgi:uncharacterized protein (TIGR03663 family)
VLTAALLRLPGLDLRPMHADEAVHAAKFGTLLEQGTYKYDPNEYHGPTLNYLTLAPARLQGISRYAALDERTLRIVPAAAGVLLVAAHFLLAPVVGFRASALAALFAAVSPAMVYYSRYYIQETLLVAFSFTALAAISRYLRAPCPGWAIAGGVSVGLMAATKETWVIAAGAMAGALVVARVAERATQDGTSGAARPRVGRHAALAALCAGTVMAMFYSSFFTHPRGIVDAARAFATYLGRAAGDGWHVQPWHYYVSLLSFSWTEGAPAWTEASILGLAAVGAVTALGRADTRWLAVYAVLIALAYSVIPYKTPWCVLGPLDACIVLAGIGASRLLTVSASPLAGPAVAVLLAAATAHLGWQAWAASFRFACHPSNPYVYAHTGTGVFEIARRVEALASAHPQRYAMPVEVISGRNLWPLPWYLRRFSTVRWETAPVNDGVHAPLILATPDVEDAIRRKLYEWRRPGERGLYVPIFDEPVELRPQVEVRGYASRILWDAALRR